MTDAEVRDLHHAGWSTTRIADFIHRPLAAVAAIIAVPYSVDARAETLAYYGARLTAWGPLSRVYD